MTSDRALDTYAYTGAFVQEMAHAGVRHVCISPGSRSAPLALAIANQRVLKSWTHIDERSGAFFALGLARALGEPVALVCTSGTAAANFFPAIVEARSAGGPLIVLYSSNLEGTQGAVTSKGGRIAKPIFAFPGGRRFHFLDPNGNELAVWSEK